MLDELETVNFNSRINDYFDWGYLMFNKVNNKVISKEYPLSNFDKVAVDIPTGHVFFKAGNRYHISYSGVEKVMPEVKVKNGELRISSPKRVVNVNLLNQLNSKIVIELPKKELEEVNIDSLNGNFSADYLSTKTGEINLSNGDIDIEELKVKSGISFDTSKGNIKIENSNASGYDLNTSLGKVIVAGKRQGDSFEANLDTKNVLEADTSLGNISIK